MIRRYERHQHITCRHELRVLRSKVEQQAGRKRAGVQNCIQLDQANSICFRFFLFFFPSFCHSVNTFTMDPSIDNVCHDIIMEYLMHSCYKNTAKAFDTEYKKQRHYSTILMQPSTTSHKLGKTFLSLFVQIREKHFLISLVLLLDAMDVDEMDCTPTTTNGKEERNESIHCILYSDVFL